MDMAKAVRIDIITKQTIRPSSPTPQHLRYIKLSLLDQLNFAMSTPILLFYPSKGDTSNIHDHIKEQSQRLKSSLSKALTLFYPLAGKITDNSFVECTDCGIQYTEAQVNCAISDVFERPDNDFLEKLMPIDLSSTLTGAIVQCNFFACGGLVIGVSLSHKITDAASLGTFLGAWATMSLGSPPPHVVLPHFVSDTIIPSMKEPSLLPPPPPLILELTKCKTRRYVLDASKVSILKAKAASKCVQQPTRVEAVTAFFWKCLMTISRSKQSGCAKSSVLTQALNFRRRLVPPLPQNYIGNLSGKFIVETKVTTSNLELADLVSLLREGLERMSNDVAKGGQTIDMAGLLEFAKEFGELHNRDDTDLYSFTSLCGFPLYEIDFGWGKPTWAIVTNLVLKNYVLMIDATDGKGVEVWMSLSEEDATLFDRNQELLAFASINPSVKCGDGKGDPALTSCL